MTPRAMIAQLRTRDLESSIAFWTERVGLPLAFRFGDFYAGIGADARIFHLKRIDTTDPSIAFVRSDDHFHLYLEVDDAAANLARLRDAGVRILRDLEQTAWGTREFVFADDQGHTIYVGQSR